MIKAETKKKRHRSHYVMLEQVGFLGEKAVILDTDLSRCSDKQRVLGNSNEAFVAVEDGSGISFALAPPGYIETMTIDEGQIRLREIPSDFHAVVLSSQAVVKLGSSFFLTLTITDPHAFKTGVVVRCRFSAKLQEYLPVYHIGDVIRVHRGLLVERSEDKKHLTTSAAGSVAAWAVFDKSGNIRSESGSTHSMTAFEQSLIEKYTQFAKTLDSETEKHKTEFQVQGEVLEAVPKDYAEISKGIFIPTLDGHRIYENDLTSISGMLEIMY